jgi:hypothetical protein
VKHGLATSTWPEAIDSQAMWAAALPRHTRSELQRAIVQPMEKLSAFTPPVEILQAAMRRRGIAFDAWRAARQDPPLPDEVELGDGASPA